eukprot:3318718-Pyramimonas_sp.AAC.1
MEELANQLRRTKNDNDPAEHWKIAKRILVLGGRPIKRSAIYPERDDTEGNVITTDQQLCEESLDYFAGAEQARVQPPEGLIT